jgi:hypothetical protein
LNDFDHAPSVGRSLHPVNALALDRPRSPAYIPPVAAHQRYGFGSPDTRRTNRQQCGFLLSVKHGTLSMGATCGEHSCSPEPCTGLPTRTFALTPFGSGRRDSKHLQGITMKTIPLGAPASIRLSVYRFVRHFTGPVTAIRLARFFSRSVA